MEKCPSFLSERLFQVGLLKNPGKILGEQGLSHKYIFSKIYFKK